MRPDLHSSMTSNYDDDRESEYNNSEYYYNPTDDMTNDESSHFEELVQTYMQDVHYTSITQTGFNLTYSMINVGIVGLPFCAYEAGLPLFVVCVIFFTYLSAYISSLLVEMAEDERVRSLEALAEKAFGTRGYFATCFVQLVFSFTVICVTLGEWGSIIPSVIETNFEDSLPSGLVYQILTDRRVIVIVGSLLALPGCFSRTFSTLSWSSFFTLSTIIVTILWSVYMLALYLDSDDDDTSGKNVLKVRSFWWTTEVIICFCLSFQQKLFFVFNCLRRRSVGRFAPALKYSHLFVAVLYITFGCVCAMHMTDVSSFKHFNYFKDYKETSESRVVFDVTRVVVSFSLLFTIPVESLVIVTVWRRVWRRYRRYQRTASYGAHRAAGAYAPVNGGVEGGGHDHDDSDDETLEGRGGSPAAAAARVNDRMCCQMISLFSSRDRDSDDDGVTDLKPPPSPHASRHTVSTACISANNSLEQRSSHPYRDHSFDTAYSHPPPSAFKSNTTDDNLKTLSEGSSTGSSGFGSTVSPPITPTRKKRTVSFQDEASSSPRPLASPAARNLHAQQRHTPRHVSSSLAGSNLLLAAESPYLLAQGKDHHHLNHHSDTDTDRHCHKNELEQADRLPFPGSHLVSAHDRVSEVSLNDGVSVMSSCLAGANELGLDVEEYPSDRRSSVGEIEAIKPSTYERFRASLPILLVWAASLVFSLFVYQTVLFSALFITALTTSVFMFMLPSMLYFRLGVKSDYESIPIFGVLPNRLFMYVLQFLGVVFMVGNFVGLSVSIYRHFHGNDPELHI